MLLEKWIIKNDELFCKLLIRLYFNAFSATRKIVQMFSVFSVFTQTPPKKSDKFVSESVACVFFWRHQNVAIS